MCDYSIQHVASTHKFTGKEHDPETNNDYFGARYYSSTMGRFLTPDWAATPVPIPYAVMGNPQTLNLYSYVENNPITGTDPDGHTDKDGSTCEQQNTCDGKKRDEEAAKRDAELREWMDRAKGELAAAGAKGTDTQYKAQNLDSSADAAKSSAQRSGAVSSTKVGGVWVNAYGGTAAQRTDELAAFSQDLTHSERGKDMLKALEGRKSGLLGLWGSTKPFDIIQMASGGSYSYAGGQAIMLDYHDVGAAYTSAHGGGTYSL